MKLRALSVLVTASMLTGCLTTANFRTIPYEAGREFAGRSDLRRASGVRWREKDGTEVLVVDGLLADPARRVVFRTPAVALETGGRPDLRRTIMEEIEPGGMEPWPEDAEPVSFDDRSPPYYEITRVNRGPRWKEFIPYPEPKVPDNTRLHGSDWPHEQGAVIDMNVDWIERSPTYVTLRFASMPITTAADLVLTPILGVGWVVGGAILLLAN